MNIFWFCPRNKTQKMWQKILYIWRHFYQKYCKKISGINKIPLLPSAFREHKKQISAHSDGTRRYFTIFPQFPLALTRKKCYTNKNKVYNIYMNILLCRVIFWMSRIRYRGNRTLPRPRRRCGRTRKRLRRWKRTFARRSRYGCPGRRRKSSPRSWSLPFFHGSCRNRSDTTFLRPNLRREHPKDSTCCPSCERMCVRCMRSAA